MPPSPSRESLCFRPPPPPKRLYLEGFLVTETGRRHLTGAWQVTLPESSEHQTSGHSDGLLCPARSRLQRNLPPFPGGRAPTVPGCSPDHPALPLGPLGYPTAPSPRDPARRPGSSGWSTRRRAARAAGSLVGGRSLSALGPESRLPKGRQASLRSPVSPPASIDSPPPPRAHTFPVQCAPHSTSGLSCRVGVATHRRPLPPLPSAAQGLSNPRLPPKHRNGT